MNFVQFSLRNADTAALRWQDSTGSYWLNLFSEGARDYISGIARDSAQLGFNEIILSWFFFPRVENPDSVSFGVEDMTVPGKDQVVRDFLTAVRFALDDVDPRIKLGLEIPLEYFLSAPHEEMGLNPGDLIHRCNFFATSFAPAHVSANMRINGEHILNPEADPNGTVQALSGHFKYLSEIAYFRPYLQAFGGFSDNQVLMQRQALADSGITMWQLVNFDNIY
jgi:hypothetical protein